MPVAVIFKSVAVPPDTSYTPLSDKVTWPAAMMSISVEVLRIAPNSAADKSSAPVELAFKRRLPEVSSILTMPPVEIESEVELKVIAEAEM